MEKERTTPEAYPLSLNALTRACNQKSNRDPVVDFDETAVVRALDSLLEKKLARRVISDDGRVPRYRHTFPEVFPMADPDLAALCILLLRGPQTVGEIRGRTERLHAFEDLEAVEGALQRLSEHASGPLVVRLPRQPGRKEARYAHLLAGEVQVEETELVEPAVLEVRAENERIANLEADLEELRQELEDLRDQFAEFKKQFE